MNREDIGNIRQLLHNIQVEEDNWRRSRLRVGELVGAVDAALAELDNVKKEKDAAEVATASLKREYETLRGREQQQHDSWKQGIAVEVKAEQEKLLKAQEETRKAEEEMERAKKASEEILKTFHVRNTALQELEERIATAQSLLDQLTAVRR